VSGTYTSVKFLLYFKLKFSIFLREKNRKKYKKTLTFLEKSDNYLYKVILNADWRLFLGKERVALFNMPAAG